jgi:hypothetical protein
VNLAFHQWKRWLALALVLLLLALVGGLGYRRWRAAPAVAADSGSTPAAVPSTAAAAIEHRTWTEPGGHYFAGTVGALGPVQISLRRSDDHYVSGRCLWERSGQRAEFSGRWLDGGWTHLAIAEGSGVTAGEVHLTGKMVGQPPAFTGQWVSADGANSVPVHLRQVAELVVFVGVSGISPLGSDDSRVLHRIEAAYPVFPESSRLLGFASRSVREVTREIAVRRLHADAVEDYLKGPHVEGDSIWRSTVEWEIDFAADRAVSLLGRLYEYEGGFHGMRTFETRTYIDTADGLHEVELADLFPPGSAGPRRVAALCVQDLERQSEDFVKDSFAMGDRQEALEMVSHSPFTLSATGLHCFYAQEELSYSHDEWEVGIPFSALRPYLRRDGPAARFEAAAPPVVPAAVIAKP